MIYGVFSIRDLKTGFLSVTVDVSDASAKRGFEHATRKPDSLFFTHPSDYSLYRVGSFDTDTGVLTSIDPDLICHATDFVR